MSDLSENAEGQCDGDDRQLVALAKAGDAGAFTVLVKHHRNKIYRLLLRYVHSPADARELAQETMLQGYRCLATFKGAAQFSTWLAGIALNLARNHVNRAPKCSLVEYCEESMSGSALACDEVNPERRYQKKTVLAMLARAIDALPPDMREHVVLIALQGYSYEEVATLLDIAVGTVKSRMSRARQKLRQDLALQGFFD